MSLIEEALRRIQDPLLTKHAAHASAPPELKTEPPPAVHSWQTTPSPFPLPPAATPSVNPLLAVSFSVLALTAVIVIGGAFWIGHRVVMQPTPVVISEPPDRPKPSERRAAPVVQPVAPTPETPAVSGNGLTLSGIVEGMGESYAVINGLIVGVGEQVDGATLLEIASGTVRLRRENGREIVLSVPR